MPDREKVLMGLEAHANLVHPCMTRDGKKCPYFEGSNVEKMIPCGTEEKERDRDAEP